MKRTFSDALPHLTARTTNWLTADAVMKKQPKPKPVPGPNPPIIPTDLDLDIFTQEQLEALQAINDELLRNEDRLRPDLFVEAGHIFAEAGRADMARLMQRMASQEIDELYYRNIGL